jgi:hypothetical protein
MTRTPVESTDVVSIGFEEVAEGPTMGLSFSPVGMMEVEFQTGAIYLYFGIPRSLYEEFLNSPSKGQFANYVIKRGPFQYQKIRNEGRH